MRLLVTRPIDDARPLARRLRQDGHQVDIAPILNIQLTPEKCPARTQPAILAVTSKNGVRALMALPATRRQKLQRLALYAVGPSTAMAARRSGWHRVMAAAGDVQDLAARIIADRPSGPIWHISGSVQAGALVAQLSAAGHQAERMILYHAGPCADWPRHVRQRYPYYDGVIIYSKRSAQLFCDKAHEIAGPKPTAYCLSMPVADQMAESGFRVKVASVPTDLAMCELLGA